MSRTAWLSRSFGSVEKEIENMKISKIHNRSARRGFTLVEVMIAGGVAAVAGIGMMSIFVITSRFVGEGFTEARIVSNSAIAIEKMSRDLTASFRNDAVAVANRPNMEDNNLVEFSLPLEDGSVERRRFRFAADTNTLEYEVQGDDDDWSSISQRSFLRDVDSFWVSDPAPDAAAESATGSEGFISFVVTVRVDMGSSGGATEYSQGIKRYSMVGRVLPRNRRTTI